MSNNFHLQLYRGTTAQNNAYTGLAGEITADTQAGNIRLHDGSKAGGYVVASMPVGSIIPFAGTTIPDGYLLCDGSAISRTTYSSLFAAIGTTYGEGDGNSTFNIPHFANALPIGTNTKQWIGIITNGRLPNIKGIAESYLTTQGETEIKPPFVYYSSSSTHWQTGTAGYIHYKVFDASTCSSIYGDRNTTQVIPAGTFMYYIIKY